MTENAPRSAESGTADVGGDLSGMGHDPADAIGQALRNLEHGWMTPNATGMLSDALVSAVRVIRSLAGSEVIGVNDDGSVWVDGGPPYIVNGRQAERAWNRDEQYAHPDSGLSRFVRAALAAKPPHFDGSRATDQACPDCGHHLSLHNADGCGISTCDCRNTPPKDADGT